MNNLSDLKSKAIIILNDNGMSIGLNTGGLSKHLNKLRVSKGYSSFKKGFGTALKKIPAIGDGLYNGVSRARDHLKYSIVEGVMFEKLGFTYIGPIDGHNIDAILHNLELAKTSDHSVIMHVITQKGKGYRNAEKDPSKFHGIGAFDKSTGELLNKSERPSYSEVFGKKLTDMARQNDRIVAVSAAMIDGTGLREFARLFPERTFDVGIAEQELITTALGLSLEGFIPFAATFAVFAAGRAYDQIRNSVCYQKSNVKIIGAHGGITVGEDGASHQALEDISLMRIIPNMTVIVPSDYEQTRQAVRFASEYNGPVYIRLSRMDVPDVYDKNYKFDIGKAVVLKEGADVSLIATGDILSEVIKASEILKENGINADVINVPVIKPLDCDSIIKSVIKTKLAVTIENHSVIGGLGAAVCECVSENSPCKIVRIGIKDTFGQSGKPDELLKEYGLDAESIANKVIELKK